MEISIADQIALDDALVAPADRLKIGKCNLRLSSDVTSKEATLQVVYDVLKLTPFYKAFQVTADAPEIYMQEFWATAYVHNRSVQATQEIEDTHVTLTPVNPDGQQHSSSVSSGFVSNMLNPNQYTGVDDIFEQHAEATSLTDTPITAIVEPSFSEAVDVAVQLKYDRIREESNTENQQFLDSIDEGMKKVIKEQSERSRMMIKDPTLETDRGSKRRRSGKEPASSSAPRETITTTTGKTTTTGSKTHKQSASQSAPVEETMQTTNVFEAPAHQEFETGVHDEQEEEESVPAVHESVQPWIAIWPKGQDPRESFDELTDTTFDFSAFVMNRLNVKTLTPELLAGPTFELIEWTCSKFD
ncbi:hypothetical protein Tco_0463095 [Tanacetum coccineum]